ncbi:MAG TPA: enolase C-terminal domain-like protein [Chitinophagaceae bacterium]|nr:enolase C-terminal domain-like protein [Chitinophagaceae bacterium]
MIINVRIIDKRFSLEKGAGSDAIHRDPVYAYSVTQLVDDSGMIGNGLSFTLGDGNELVCQAAEFYAQKLIGKDIEELMHGFDKVSNQLSNDQRFRWLGPQKGVVQLALASVTNACFDLWAKKRGLPLWKLLTGLSPKEILNLLDLSYLEDELTSEQAYQLLQSQVVHKEKRKFILAEGYPGYDTSVGWFNYPDEQIKNNCRKAADAGFTAMKLKVGSADPDRDIRRAYLVRETVGDEARIMLDANQQWTLPQAMNICDRLRSMRPYWIEEPTHPDDIHAHKILADHIQPLKLALGEHLPNKIIFKNYLQTKCAGFIQVDALRVAGVSEFITVSLLAKKYGIPVVPHVGDMGQLHQHLVLFNHISLGHDALFLEYIPHLQRHFLHPAQVTGGRYKTPQEPGSSCDFK